MDKTENNCIPTTVESESVNNSETPIVQKLEDPAPTPQLIPIGPNKYVRVSKYRGNVYINIRDYIKEDTGKFYATKRGVLLTPNEWLSLKERVSAIDRELQAVDCVLKDCLNV